MKKEIDAMVLQLAFAQAILNRRIEGDLGAMVHAARTMTALVTKFVAMSGGLHPRRPRVFLNEPAKQPSNQPCESAFDTERI